MATTSIIITTYNGMAYVARAIGSALGQSDSAVEVVVVDDGSTDDTPQFLAALGDKIRVVRHHGNRGLSAACNSGVRASRGDFIVRLDDDDYFTPALVERLRAALDAHAEAGFAYGDYYTVDPDGRILARISLPDFFPGIVHHCDLIATGTLFRRRCFEEIGLFDESLRSQEIYDFYIRVTRRFPGMHVAEPLFYYTRRPGQMTADIDRLRHDTERIRLKHGLAEHEVVKW